MRRIIKVMAVKKKNRPNFALPALTIIGSLTFIFTLISGLALWLSINVGSVGSHLSNIDCSECYSTPAYIAHQQHQRQLSDKVFWGTIIISCLLLGLTYISHKKAYKSEVLKLP